MPVAALHLPEPLTASSRLLASVPSGAQAGGCGDTERNGRGCPSMGPVPERRGAGWQAQGGTSVLLLEHLLRDRLRFRTECGHLPVRYGVTWARAGERRDLRSSAELGICEDSCVPHAWTPSTSKALC